MKRRISHPDNPRPTNAVPTERGANMPSAVSPPAQVLSLTLKRAREKLVGNGPLELPAQPAGSLPPDLLQMLASRLKGAPGLVAWSSLNKTHLAALSDCRETLWLHACMRERERLMKEDFADGQEAAQLLAQFLDAFRQADGIYQRHALQAFSPRMQAAILLLHFAASHGDAPFPADAAQRLSETGAAMLHEALLWLDHLSPAEHTAADRQSAAHDWQIELAYYLRDFWYGWPRIFPALAQSLSAQTAETNLVAALVDTVLRLLLERPAWRESSILSRLDALETLVGLAQGEPQQAATRRGQLLLIHNRYHPGSIEHARANDFLEALSALEKESLQPFLQALAHTGAAFYLRIPESALPSPIDGEVARAQLHDAIEAGISLHHPAVTWADLLLFAARTHLLPAAVGKLSEPLHGILVGELRLLRMQFEWLNQGRQTQDFKSLLTEVPKQWKDISTHRHRLLTARNLQKFYLDPDGVPRAFEMRVQRLCSALRNLCHVVHAQAAPDPMGSALDPMGSAPDPAVLALRLRLRGLFDLWPTKPGRRTLLAWLKQ